MGIVILDIDKLCIVFNKKNLKFESKNIIVIMQMFFLRKTHFNLIHFYYLESIS
jgi:hypothetical protein